MSFVDTFRAIKDKVFWEEVPVDLIGRIIPMTQPSDVAVLVQALDAYDRARMRDDAGDVADERHRMMQTVALILDGLAFPYEAELVQRLPVALPFTQIFILKIIAQRKYLPAYSAIVQLQQSTQNPQLQQQCRVTLQALGF